MKNYTKYINFRKSIISFLLLLFLLNPLKKIYPEFQLDLRNYKDGPYTKFSDWIPRKLHKWEPMFVEDFYELYALKLLYGENELRRNIFFLKIGMKRRFRHPRNAFIKIMTKEEYHKYRLLIYMQMNLAIMRSYMRIASLYDKRHLYFYNLDFADDLEKSFSIAKIFYKQAFPYWEKAKKNAKEANKYLFEIDMGTLESKRFQIVRGELDFEKIINKHLSSVGKKLQTVKVFLDKQGRPRPVKKWMSDADDPKLNRELKKLYKAGINEMK